MRKINVSLNMDYVDPMITASWRKRPWAINYLNQYKDMYLTSKDLICNLIAGIFKNPLTGYEVDNPENCFIVSEEDVSDKRETCQIVPSEIYALDMKFLKYTCKKTKVSCSSISKILGINYNAACLTSRNVAGNILLQISQVLNCNPLDLIKGNEKDEDYETSNGFVLYDKYKVNYNYIIDVAQKKNVKLKDLSDAINVSTNKFQDMIQVNALMFGKDIVAIADLFDVKADTLLLLKSRNIIKATKIEVELDKKYNIDYNFIDQRILDLGLRKVKVSEQLGHSRDWMIQKKRCLAKLKGYDVIEIANYLECKPEDIICFPESEKASVRGIVNSNKPKSKKIKLNREKLLKLAEIKSITPQELYKAIGRERKSNGFGLKYATLDEISIFANMLNCETDDIAEYSSYKIDYRILDILCNALRISYSDLSEKIGKEPDFISKCFRMESRMEKDDIFLLCKELNCRINDIVIFHKTNLCTENHHLLEKLEDKQEFFDCTPLS